MYEHLWMSHVTHELSHITQEWDMSHGRTTSKKKKWSSVCAVLTCGLLLPYVCVPRASMNESRHAWIESRHIWTSHVTHMNESCHTGGRRGWSVVCAALSSSIGIITHSHAWHDPFTCVTFAKEPYKRDDIVDISCDLDMICPCASQETQGHKTHKDTRHTRTYRVSEMSLCVTNTQRHYMSLCVRGRFMAPKDISSQWVSFDRI